MQDKDIGKGEYKPWHPMTDPVDLKTLLKFNEELGECVSAGSRCLLQGINECDHETGYVNKLWLEDEIADVLANAKLVIERFQLDVKRIDQRADRKYAFLKPLHEKA